MCPKRTRAFNRLLLGPECIWSHSFYQNLMKLDLFPCVIKRYLFDVILLADRPIWLFARRDAFSIPGVSNCLTNRVTMLTDATNTGCQLRHTFSHSFRFKLFQASWDITYFQPSMWFIDFRITYYQINMSCRLSRTFRSMNATIIECHSNEIQL